MPCALFALIFAACADEPITLQVGDRSAPAYLPPDAAGPLPVVLMLHGYGTTAERNDRYLKLHEEALARGMAAIVPDGLKDDKGEQYWNAFDSCCDFDGREQDDVGYLLGLLDALAAQVEIDPARVYIVGYSNGGFMAFRAACEHPERFAAIAPWVGALDGDPAACAPAEPVSLVHVRAVEDGTILYDGGEIEGFPYLSAGDSAAQFAGLVGCAAETEAGEARDMVRRPRGAETEVERWTGCPEGIDVELWSMVGSGHVPLYEDAATGQVLDFLLAHQKAL